MILKAIGVSTRNKLYSLMEQQEQETYYVFKNLPWRAEWMNLVLNTGTNINLCLNFKYCMVNQKTE